MEEKFEEKIIRRHHGPHHHHPHFWPLEDEEKFLQEADLGMLLMRAGHELHLRNARLGVSQDKILKFLSEKKTMSQRELRHTLHVKPGSLSEILSKMEEKGLLNRERSAEDHRHCTLNITDEGEKLAATIVPVKEEELLNKEDEEALKELLRKLIKAARS